MFCDIYTKKRYSLIDLNFNTTLSKKTVIFVSSTSSQPKAGQTIAMCLWNFSWLSSDTLGRWVFVLPSLPWMLLGELKPKKIPYQDGHIATSNSARSVSSSGHGKRLFCKGRIFRKKGKRKGKRKGEEIEKEKKKKRRFTS